MKKLLFIAVAIAMASCGQNGTKNSTSANSDSSAAAKPAESKPSTPWTYQTDTDKMTSKQGYYALVTATNKLDFAFPYEGGSTGMVVIRNRAGVNEVEVQINKGQFLGGEGHDVSVKFDNDAPLTFATGEPNDGSTTLLFLEEPAKFLSRIKTAKKMIVQAEFFESGTKEMEFDVAGLKWDH